MKRFVVYEVWTTARIIEAHNHADASRDAAPAMREGLNLCNWHVVEIPRQQVNVPAGELRILLAEEHDEPQQR